MRADNRGEGGILALTALVVARPRRRNRGGAGGSSASASSARRCSSATHDHAGDLGARRASRGSRSSTPALHPYIVPVAVVIMVALFAIQKHGTARSASCSGRSCACGSWRSRCSGIVQIVEQPAVLAALNPALCDRVRRRSIRCRRSSRSARWCSRSPAPRRCTPTWAISARTPIRRAWLFFVVPGAGAQLLRPGRAAARPTRPRSRTRSTCSRRRGRCVPLVVLATCRGDHRVAGGDLGRVLARARRRCRWATARGSTIEHTSEREIGQIYVPFINWTLLVAVIAAGRRLPQLERARRRVRHRGDAGDADRLDPDLLRDAAAVELADAARARDRACRSLLIDLAFLSSNALKIPGRRLVPDR